MGVKMSNKKAMELNIGGHLYKIVELPLEHEDNDKELYGRHLVKDNIILINEGIEKTRKLETLIHEILHAICYNTGLQQEMDRLQNIAWGKLIRELEDVPDREDFPKNDK